VGFQTAKIKLFLVITIIFFKKELEKNCNKKKLGKTSAGLKLFNNQ